VAPKHPSLPSEAAWLQPTAASHVSGGRPLCASVRGQYARAVGDALTLEIVEGPGAGRQLVLDRPIVIGRALDSDFVIEDDQVSRRHARVSPTPEGFAVVEDLGSANGTFVNRDQLYGPARIDPGDELLVGVAVIQARSGAQVAAQPSAIRAVPPALAIAPRPPSYLSPEANQPVVEPPKGATELEKYLDVRVRRRAQLAPLALFVLVALALIVYLAVH
jgi:pSer/pThr/pTyr-binding forkhead associated (FHA) protein